MITLETIITIKTTAAQRLLFEFGTFYVPVTLSFFIILQNNIKSAIKLFYCRFYI